MQNYRTLLFLTLVQGAFTLIMTPSLSQSISRSSLAGQTFQRMDKRSARWIAARMISSNEGSISATLSSLLVCGLLTFGQGVMPAVSEPVSPIYDQARSLGSAQNEKLAAELTSFEQRTGWKIRVLTRDSRRQEQQLSPQQIRDFWKLPDEKAVPQS